MKTVIDQFQRTCKKPVIFTLHTHKGTPLLAELEQQGVCYNNWGLQSVFWTWRSKWRYTHLPYFLYTSLAWMLFPLYLAISFFFPRCEAAKAIQQIKDADIVYIFGGTNFARQWFHLNIPYYILTSILAKIFRGKVYLGPQQYGPMTKTQTFITRLWLRWAVDDFRMRNCLDFPILCSHKHRHDKLLWDEVFSNFELYPTMQPGSSQPQEYILLNVRGGNLSDGQSNQLLDFAPLANCLEHIYKEFCLPYLFFSVSDASFCDDRNSYQKLKQYLDNKGIPFNIYEIIFHENELIRIAQKAKACLSMSFHGCLLSSFAGIPCIPIVDGFYYEYKYADFDRYGGGTPVPKINLKKTALAESKLIIEYIKRYDPCTVVKLRKKASKRLREYYGSIIQQMM